MNNLLYQQLDELLTNSPSRTNLKCESMLRVGAGTLCRGASGQITATTVVCEVAGNDIGAFESLVAEIAEEYGLVASIKQQAGDPCRPRGRPI